MSLGTTLPGEAAVQDIQSPMIYIQEEATWQYKTMAIDLQKDPMPDEKSLDELGADGWELASMIVYGQSLYIYFKRLKNG